MQPEPMPNPATQPIAGTLRLCRADDLPKLEWFGAFTAHRQIIADAFAMQERDEGLMLVCDVDEFPIGQVWIRFAEARPRTARLWALRVLESFRNKGVGARLICGAEQELAARGFSVCEIGVDKDNSGAHRLYERLGYKLSHAAVEPFTYVTPAGERRQEIADQWILRKLLRPHADR